MSAHTIDLHMHTYYSDGRASPEELVRHAANIGLKTIAITDHDNIRGNLEARVTADELSIELIPAIEFTTCWNGVGDNVDLLGYFVDFEHPGFLALAQKALDDIQDRIDETCQRLSAAGYAITLDDVFADNPRYAGAMETIHVLQTKGYGADFRAAAQLFGEHWNKQRQCIVGIDEAIATIRDAGGVAVLAHPTLVLPEPWLQARQVAQLVEMGLGGIEVYHHRLNETARVHFSVLAAQFNLPISGGSDEHGWPAGFPNLGREPITPEMVAALRARTNRQMV